MAMRIYHNPRCSKSRQTLSLIEDRGLGPEVVRQGGRARLGRPPEHGLDIL